MKRTFYIIIVIICLISIYSSVKSIYDLWGKRDILAQEQQKLLKEEALNKTIKTQLKQSKSNFYMEQVARDKLFMLKNGEDVVLMKTPNSSSGFSIRKQNSNIDQWLSLFF